MATLKAHAVAPHMAAYGAKTKDLVAKRCGPCPDFRLNAPLAERLRPRQLCRHLPVK